MSNLKTLEVNRAKVEAETLEFIDGEIESLKRRKVKYDYISHMAEYIAQQISRKRKSNLSYTTLLRNKVYKRRLALYMGVTDKKAELSLSERKELEEEVYDNKITIGKLQRENERLKHYFATVSNEKPQLDNKKNEVSGKETAQHFAVIINSLKAHFEDEIVWDKKCNAIIDNGLEKTIIDGEPVKVFFKWMEDARKLRGGS